MIPKPDPDYLLLQGDPNGLILAYQGMVEIIVKKYIRSGMFSVDSYSDVVQTVNVELLHRVHAIQANYNGSSLLRTYVSTVIRNICLKLHDKGIYEKPDNPPVIEKLLPHASALDRYSVGQARRTFWAIMQQFSKDLPKLIICLKLRYRIVLEREDVLHWYPECSSEAMSQLIARFGSHSPSRTEKETYVLMTPIVNAAEGKSNSPDALRKWTASKIDEILGLLNSSIPQSSFDEDSLRILVEDYFSPFLLAD